MRGDLPLMAYQKKLVTELRKERLTPKRCFAADGTCDAIIKAHSISLSALSLIAKGGRVYVFEPVIADSLENVFQHQTHRPVPKSASDVSTFAGFCGKHDNQLFMEIDNAELVPTTDQCARIAFRTLARNYYDVLRGPQAIERISNAPLPSGMNRQLEKDYVASQTKFVRDAQKVIGKHVEHFRDGIARGQVLPMQQMLLRLDGVPEVMCSEAFVPLFDLAGAQLPKPPARPPTVEQTEFVCINVSTDKRGGYVHLTWRNGMSIVDSFVESWRAVSFSLSKLFCTIFAFMGNFAFSETWWKGQSVIRAKQLMSYYTHPFFMHENPQAPRDTAEAIARDHRKYSSRQVVEVIGPSDRAHA